MKFVAVHWKLWKSKVAAISNVIKSGWIRIYLTLVAKLNFNRLNWKLNRVIVYDFNEKSSSKHLVFLGFSIFKTSYSFAFSALDPFINESWYNCVSEILIQNLDPPLEGALSNYFILSRIACWIFMLFHSVGKWISMLSLWVTQFCTYLAEPVQVLLKDASLLSPFKIGNVWDGQLSSTFFKT